MDANTFIRKLKHILSEKKLNKLGKEVGFTKRERSITAFPLVTSFIAAMGEKKTDYFAEILRYYNQLTGQNIQYKPFHNQITKPEFASLMGEVANSVLNHWINDVLKYTKPESASFKDILIQDGSSFMLPHSLQEVFPGRFKVHAPAAIELHATLNLTQMCFERAGITPDSYPERDELPPLNELKGNLLLADRGYYSARYITELMGAGAYFIIRAKGLKAVKVQKAVNDKGKNFLKKTNTPLNEVMANLPKGTKMDDMDIMINKKLTRVISYWSKSDEQNILLATNLGRKQFTALEISQFYRLRWQVELLFKECKSYPRFRSTFRNKSVDKPNLKL